MTVQLMEIKKVDLVGLTVMLCYALTFSVFLPSAPLNILIRGKVLKMVTIITVLY